MSRQRKSTTSERGYGPEHDRLRAELAPVVATGTVRCWRCGRLIAAGAPWHLGHDDVDRSVYRGPEHPRCNTSAAAKIGNRLRGLRRRGIASTGARFDTSRRW